MFVEGGGNLMSLNRRMIIWIVAFLILITLLLFFLIAKNLNVSQAHLKEQNQVKPLQVDIQVKKLSPKGVTPIKLSIKGLIKNNNKENVLINFSDPLLDVRVYTDNQLKQMVLVDKSKHFKNDYLLKPNDFLEDIVIIDLPPGKYTVVSSIKYETDNNFNFGSTSQRASINLLSNTKNQEDDHNKQALIAEFQNVFGINLNDFTKYEYGEPITSHVLGLNKSFNEVFKSLEKGDILPLMFVKKNLAYILFKKEDGLNHLYRFERIKQDKWDFKNKEVKIGRRVIEFLNIE